MWDLCDKKSLPAAFPQEEALFVKVHNRVSNFAPDKIYQ